MKKLLRSFLIILAFISVLCCSPDFETFELYRSHVVGEYTVDYLEISVDSNYFNHKEYKFDIIEPSPHNYEIKFNPIHTPDSTYTLANLTFKLQTYTDHVYPAAYVLIDSGQHLQRLDYYTYSDWIYAGPYMGHSRKSMNIALTIVSASHSSNSIRRLRFFFAFKPIAA